MGSNAVTTGNATGPSGGITEVESLQEDAEIVRSDRYSDDNDDGEDAGGGGDEQWHSPVLTVARLEY